MMSVFYKFPEEPDKKGSEQTIERKPFNLEANERSKLTKELGLGTPTSDLNFDKLTKLAGKFAKTPYASFKVCLGNTKAFTQSSYLSPELTHEKATELEQTIDLKKTLESRKTLIHSGDNTGFDAPSSATTNPRTSYAFICVPVFSPNGYEIGVFSVGDIKPRIWETEEVELVQELAQLVMRAIETRYHQLQHRNITTSEMNQLHKVLSVANCLVWEAEVNIEKDEEWNWTFNISPSGLFYRLFGELVPPPNVGLWYRFNIPQREEMNRRAYDALITGKKGYHQQFQVETPSGTYWIHEDVSIQSIGKNKYWLVAVATDITNQKQLESEITQAKELAQEASKHKSEFLANMSHEIRTPMNGIIGITNILSSENLNSHQAHLTDLIKESADSLLEIINSILDFSKIEAGKLEICKTEIDLREIAKSVINLLVVEAQKKGLTLDLSIDENLSPMHLGDPVRIRQILVNLVGNGIKFTEKGSVGISIENSSSSEFPNRIRFTVKDTGIGIDKEDLKIICEPFKQADGSMKRNYGGTGLGLAITKQLIEAMAGSISISSKLGKGSTFYFELDLEPLSPTTESSLKPAPSPPEELPKPKQTERNMVDLQNEKESGIAKRFLVVDDNAINRMVCRKMLQTLGYQVDEAVCGKSALESLQKQDYAAVLMDCQMPEMDGYEATQRIRKGEALPKNKNIPIIGITAHAMAGDRQKCLSHGMDDYLSKPIKRQSFAETISNCLKKLP